MKKNSFTLIEAITTIFIMTVGIIGISGLISQLIASTAIYSQRLIAAYLAQEGIEIVRNIRDTNWLQREPWDNGLGVGNWEADYNDENLSSYTGAFLRIDGGFYNYESGTETIFRRRIIITKPQDYILEIRVQVLWEEKGRSYQLTAQENLYNWR